MFLVASFYCKIVGARVVITTTLIFLSGVRRVKFGSPIVQFAIIFIAGAKFMTKKIPFFFIFFACSTTWATPTLESKVLRISGATLVFEQDKDQHILLSKNCMYSGSKCEAFKALLQVSKLKPLTKKDSNPGDQICKSLKDAKVIMAETEDGDPLSLCEFPDHSSVDCGSLFYFMTSKQLPILNH